MIYVLITIGAFISIITTAVFNSITKKQKYQNILRALVVIFSFTLFVACCIFILNQKTFE
jgi:cytochrome bd-type quinol oxidase subunit 1